MYPIYFWVDIPAEGTVHANRSILHSVANYSNAIAIRCKDRCNVVSSYSHVMAMVDIYGTFSTVTLYPYVH